MNDRDAGLNIKKNADRSRLAKLWRAVKAHSASPDRSQDLGPNDEIVLFAPPPLPGQVSCAGLPEAFAAAKRLRSSSNRAIRIVAEGATIRSTWPEWFRGAKNVAVTEAGAYRTTDPVTATRPMGRVVRGWLDATFATIIRGVRPADLFYSSACSRFLQRDFSDSTYLPAMIELHGDPNVIVVSRTPEGARSRWNPYWKMSFASLLVWQFARAAAGQVRNFIRHARSRRELALLRSEERGTPDLWLALVPNWRRVNRHVFEVVVPAAKRSGLRIGILWVVTLRTGEVGDASLAGSQGSRLWPTLDELDVPNTDLVIDQLVGPETLSDLASLLLSGVAATWRVGRRLLRAGSAIDAKGSNIGLTRHLRGLARLASTDLLQALAIERAFRRASCRHDFRKASVVFSSLSQVDTATPEALLRRQGATTFDFKHGSGGGGWFGQTETFATWTAVWTATDAINCSRQGSQAIVIRSGRTCLFETAPRAIRNVLFLTNYVHRDWKISNFPTEPFQRELLSVAEIASRRWPGAFEFRWRPHPDDVDRLVESEARTNSAIKIWREGTLQEAIEWADLAITSPSSTMAQALAASVPVMVHASPSVSFLPEIKAVAEERRFFYAEDGADKLKSVAALFASGDKSSANADRELTRQLWPDFKGTRREQELRSLFSF